MDLKEASVKAADISEGELSIGTATYTDGPSGSYGGASQYDPTGPGIGPGAFGEFLQLVKRRTEGALQ